MLGKKHKMTFTPKLSKSKKNWVIVGVPKKNKKKSKRYSDDNNGSHYVKTGFHTPEDEFWQD